MCSVVQRPLFPWYPITSYSDPSSPHNYWVQWTLHFCFKGPIEVPPPYRTLFGSTLRQSPAYTLYPNCSPPAAWVSASSTGNPFQHSAPRTDRTASTVDGFRATVTTTPCPVRTVTQPHRYGPWVAQSTRTAIWSQQDSLVARCDTEGLLGSVSLELQLARISVVKVALASSRVLPPGISSNFTVLLESVNVRCSSPAFLSPASLVQSTYE